MEEKLDSQFQQLYKGCLSNERPSELLLLWRSRIESMMTKEDIYFLGIYTVLAYLHYPMNLINEVRFLRIFCHLHLEEKIKRHQYEKNNFSLHQKNHPFDIFNIFDMYTFVLGVPPLTNEERYSILQSLSYEEKRFLMNNLYPDFSETDFAVEGSFQFKAFEAFVATDESFEDPPVIYSEYEKFKYLCLNCKVFTYRCLWTSTLLLAILFNYGFLVTIAGLIFNLVFFQFGFILDKLIFGLMYKKVSSKETVDTCRRVWKRLQIFMNPLPPGKYVGALSLCVDEVQGKKHIEFKFCEDKYDQVLGQYYLNETRVTENLLIQEYPNTGIFFWYSIFADVKITRRKMKLGSYLRMEKFTPEFFLVDFQYFQPYPENQLSRIMCLSALFELVKITLELHFPGSSLVIISNGFMIKAPNTHTRVKISAVARYCLDKLGIGNSCNKTPRYMQLKEKIYKDLTNRLMVCKRDMEAPMEYSAIVPIRKDTQIVKYVPTKEVRTVEERFLNPEFHQTVNMPDHVRRFVGLKDTPPTVGWIMPALNYENKTLNLGYFPPRMRNLLTKRLKPLVEKNFNHYSGGFQQPFSEYEVRTHVTERITSVRVHIEDDYPDEQRNTHYHKEIKVAPVSDILRKLEIPSEKKTQKIESRLEIWSELKKEEKNAREKSMRKERRTTRVKETLRSNFRSVKSKLVGNGICRKKDSDYVAKNVCKLIYRRSRASGIVYNRVDKSFINQQIKDAKRRYRERKRQKQPFVISNKFAKQLKELRKESLKDSSFKQIKYGLEYLSPYVAHSTDAKLRADNAFKLFLIKRRLSEYGIPWKKIHNILETYDIARHKIRLNRIGIPRNFRNLMRNIVTVVPKSVAGERLH